MLNRIDILGRLTRDPELRYTQSGTAVASFTVACDRDFADQSGKRGVDFIDCVAWRGTGEFVSKYFQKGSMICVSGRLQIRDWTDDKGNKRRNAEILTEHVYFAGSKSQGSGNTSTGNATDISAENFEEDFEDFDELADDGELPF